MLIRPPSDVAASEITPREIYLRRREFLRGAAALGVAGGLSGVVSMNLAHAAPLQAAKSPLSTAGEALTPLRRDELQQLLRVRH